MEPSAKLLYSRVEAAAALSLSVSSLDVMIGRGMIRARRQGRRVLIPRTEIERVSHRDIPAIWPAKEDGKTVNRATDECLRP
jgi:excisionase family DNA binding protein